MRVVSWNLGLNTGRSSRPHSEAWRFLLEKLKPDVALVQEAVPPEDLDRSVAFVRPWARRMWGSAIVTAPGRIRKTFADSSGGPVVVAEMEDGAIMASIHARIVKGRTIPTLRHTLKRVLPRLKGRRCVIGGDLNTARGAAAIWPRHGHREFFESLTGMGLYDCHWELNGRESRSFWGEVSPHELQLDHLFVDLETGRAGRVTECWIETTGEVRELSDHSPIIAEIQS
jgi:endonuclease/exonuclease/phosphatase family metal-dependent hydrolase